MCVPREERNDKKVQKTKGLEKKKKALTRKAHSYRKGLKRKAIIIKQNSCHNILVRSLYIDTNRIKSRQTHTL